MDIQEMREEIESESRDKRHSQISDSDRDERCYACCGEESEATRKR